MVWSIYITEPDPGGPKTYGSETFIGTMWFFSMDPAAKINVILLVPTPSCPPLVAYLIRLSVLPWEIIENILLDI